MGTPLALSKKAEAEIKADLEAHKKEVENFDENWVEERTERDNEVEAWMAEQSDYSGIEFVGIDPRIYVNSFPKAGTHLALTTIAHIAKGQQPKHWLGSFHRHSWSGNWVPLRLTTNAIRGQSHGTWMIGHMGYKPEFEDAFLEMGTCMIFNYRDLRDVAVSLTYHIESDSDVFAHPGKEQYQALGSHEEILKAVVIGIEDWPGVLDRWKYYAPWIDKKWVLSVKYENLIVDPERSAKRILDHVMFRTSQHQGFIPIMMEENYINAIAQSVKLQTDKELSVTYRTGKSGNWREEFTPEIKELFKQHDRDNWLVKLGYEKDNNW